MKNLVKMMMAVVLVLSVSGSVWAATKGHPKAVKKAFKIPHNPHKPGPASNEQIGTHYFSKKSSGN